MSDNLKDILSHLSPEIDQETLLLYLQNKLSVEKKHEVERKLLEMNLLTKLQKVCSNLKTKRNLR